MSPLRDLVSSFRRLALIRKVAITFGCPFCAIVFLTASVETGDAMWLIGFFAYALLAAFIWIAP